MFQEYGIQFSSYFNVMWREPRLHIPSRVLGNSSYNMPGSEECGEGEADPEALIPVNLELVNLLWLPNIFVYNLKTFKVVSVLQRHAGLWITRHKDIMYSQATQIHFICPMRFDNFPLDTQVRCRSLICQTALCIFYQICKLQVGSYSYDMSKMAFDQTDKVQG